MDSAGPAPATGARAEFRLDVLTREWVAITGSRQSRPNLPTGECPFCVGGVEAEAPYAVKAFPNRWPPLEPGPAVAGWETDGDPASRLPRAERPR